MKRLAVIAAAGLGAIAVAAVAVAGFWLLRSDDPDLATEAPPIPTAAPVGLAATAAPPAPDVPRVDTRQRVRRFVIVPGESEAKYVVQETLQGLPATAVGTTSEISGEIWLTPEGLYTGNESRFTVDLRTLRSDESRRDNFIRTNTLQTSRYPYATFVVEEVTGFPADYAEGEQVELSLSGTMTIKDVSRPLTFSVLARQAGDTLTATADADFNMTDFGITRPRVAIATARDEVHIQIVLVAREP